MGSIRSLPFTIAELARTAGTPYASAHREVSRITTMGLATALKRGQAVEVQARRDTPIIKPLAEILTLTYGPAVVIPNYLAGIAGIERAFIYGSWAAHHLGEPGDAPGDIDLLLIGNPSRSEIHEAVRLTGTATARRACARGDASMIDRWDRGRAEVDRLIDQGVPAAQAIVDRATRLVEVMPPY